MKRTNIMLTNEQHSMLTRIANKKGSTLGEIKGSHQPRISYERLPSEKEIAVETYKKGLISIGEISEILGPDPVSTRNYLKGKGIKLQTQDKKYLLRDMVNA